MSQPLELIARFGTGEFIIHFYAKALLRENRQLALILNPYIS